VLPSDLFVDAGSESLLFFFGDSFFGYFQAICLWMQVATVFFSFFGISVARRN